MTLKQFRNMLLTISKNVFHGEAWDVDDNYIVWMEDGEISSFFADDIKDSQVIQGTVDFFSSDEYSEMVNKIQNLFNENYISWRLNSVQYESLTKLTHWEWIWEVEMWHG